MTEPKPYRAELLEALRDPIEAIAYLQAAADESIEAFRESLRNAYASHVSAADKAAREAAEARVKELEKYAKHRMECRRQQYSQEDAGWYIDDTKPCTCGLAALLEGK